MLFVAICIVAIITYSSLQRRFAPKKPPQAQKAPPGEQKLADRDGPGEQASKEARASAEGDPKDTASLDEPADESKRGESNGETERQGDTPPSIAASSRKRHPAKYVVLGDYTGRSPPFFLFFNTIGASLERVELVARKPNGKLRYRNLEEDTGYLGYLGLAADRKSGGCRVRTVAAGTPAARATPVSGTDQIGVQVGDIILSVGGKEIKLPADLKTVLKSRRKGTKVAIKLLRPAADPKDTDRVSVTLQAELGPHPLELMQLEPDSLGNIRRPMLTTLLSLNELSLQKGRELPGVMMHVEAWELVRATKTEVVFRYEVPKAVCERAGIKGSVAILKRFALIPSKREQKFAGKPGDYDIRCFFSCEYDGAKPINIALRQEGPNGLPQEGWWYTTKISPAWGGAGARDVVWRNETKGRGLLSAGKLYSEAKKGKAQTSLLPGKGKSDRTFDYLGVDAQYFSAVMLPGGKPGSSMVVADARAFPVGLIGTLKGRGTRRQNTSFSVDWLAVQCEGQPDRAQPLYDFRLFLGPKDPVVLAHDQLEGLIEYGWFGFVAKPLSHLLHFFYAIVRNYGIAIILLTVLVRGCMFPLGRKAARNAQMMQELSPEIKKINEKYKDDMEKRAEATKELWKKHNFHPLSGCWVMFLQLPIFIGLYRSISVDINLRQAALIPGISWCSNLAGPDQFLYWKTEALAFLTSETGWLGPYLNLLPIVTIVLFLVQQKLFTPPPTDEQSRMQQKMMKYMMVFFGVMFFKVPSGLCIYFISSSLWGIAERKLLPKPAPPKPVDPNAPVKKGLLDRVKDMAEGKTGGNGAPVDRRKRKLPNAKKKR